MSIIKTYSGTVTDTTTGNKVNGYGGTSNVSIHIGKTTAINNVIVEFLTECGVEVSYDGHYLWINGFPVFLYIPYNQSYAAITLPFASSNTAIGTTSTGIFFSGMNYNVKLAFDGNPNGTFLLRISTNYTAPTFLNGFFIIVAKTKDCMSGKEVFGAYSAIMSSSGTFSYLYFYGKDSEGKPINIYNYEKRLVINKLATTAYDMEANPGKFPLFHSYSGIFLIEDSYCNPDNFGINCAHFTNESLVEVEIGGKTYFSTFSMIGLVDKNP